MKVNKFGKRIENCIPIPGITNRISSLVFDRVCDHVCDRVFDQICDRVFNPIFIWGFARVSGRIRKQIRRNNGNK